MRIFLLKYRAREPSSYLAHTFVLPLCYLSPLSARPGKTTVARLYYRLLKDVGVFANAEQKARELKAAKEAEEKKKADAAKKAQEDAIRQACRSVGLTYDPRKAPPKNPVQAPAPAPIPAPSPALQATAAKGMQLQGFVETTGADLADNGVGGLKDMLEKIRTAGGGVLFVDEVTSPSS